MAFEIWLYRYSTLEKLPVFLHEYKEVFLIAEM